MNDIPDLGFINAPSDRASSLRGNSGWLDQQVNNQQSKVIVFIGDRPVISIKSGALAIDYARPDNVLKLVRQTNLIFLHLNSNGNAVFAAELEEEHTDKFVHETTKLIDLRSLAMQAVLPSSDIGALAQARSLLSWHAFHRFCANCGAKTAIADAGYRRDCNACKRQHFPRVDPVVIMLIRHGDSFLMGRGHDFEENHFSALAGFLEPGETIEAATRRETFEETGIEVGDVHYLISQPWPFPSTLMIGVMGEAITTNISIDPGEIAQARWFSFDEIRQMLVNKHPEGTTLPPPMSIAYQMMQKYLNDGAN